MLLTCILTFAGVKGQNSDPIQLPNWYLFTGPNTQGMNVKFSDPLNISSLGQSVPQPTGFNTNKHYSTNAYYDNQGNLKLYAVAEGRSSGEVYFYDSSGNKICPLSNSSIRPSDEINITAVPGACEKYLAIAGGEVNIIDLDTSNTNCSNGNYATQKIGEYGSSGYYYNPPSGYADIKQCGGIVNNAFALSKYNVNTESYFLYAVKKKPPSSQGPSSGKIVKHKIDFSTSNYQFSTLDTFTSSVIALPHYYLSEMDLSPDQRKLAVGNTDFVSLTFLDQYGDYSSFDTVKFKSMYPKAFTANISGVEFDKTSKRLVVNFSQPVALGNGDTSNTVILKIDETNQQIIYDTTSLDHDEPFKASHIEMGRDHKLYMASGNSLGAITFNYNSGNPTGFNFDTNALNLSKYYPKTKNFSSCCGNGEDVGCGVRPLPDQIDGYHYQRSGYGITPPSLTITAPGTDSNEVCEGTSVTIDAGTNANWYTKRHGRMPLAMDTQTLTYKPDTTTKIYAANVSASGCESYYRDSVKIMVETYPEVDFGITHDTCITHPVFFHDLSTNEVGPINSWQWHFGDGDSSTNQNPQHLYDQNGNYQVVLEASSSFGCIGYDTQTVDILTTLIADFIHGSFSYCSTDSIAFSDNSTLVYSGASYLWNFGDGNTDTNQNFIHSYDTAGAYEATLIVSNNGCSDTARDSVSVYPPPAINHPDTVEACANDTFFLNPTASGKGPFSFTWTGPAANFKNCYDCQNVHVPASALGGSSWIVLQVTDDNGCSTKDTFFLKQNNLPSPAFSLPLSVCENTAPIALDSLVNPLGGYYTGNTVDTIVENGQPKIVFDPTSTPVGNNYAITYHYQDSNGCTGTAQRYIDVNNAPPAPNVWHDTVCKGNDAILKAEATNATGYLWYNTLTSTLYDTIGSGDSLIVNNVTQHDTFFVASYIKYNTTICTKNRAESYTFTLDQPDKPSIKALNIINDNNWNNNNNWAIYCSQDTPITLKTNTTGGPFQYQWKKLDNGTYSDIPGATDSLITVSYADTFKETITSSSGCQKTSNKFKLYHGYAKSDIQGNTLMCPNRSMDLIDGESRHNYWVDWYRNGQLIDTLDYDGQKTVYDTGHYYYIAYYSIARCSDTSNKIHITHPPELTLTPNNSPVYIPPNQNIAVVDSVVNSDYYSNYQWYRNGNPISVTDEQFEIEKVNDPGNYYVTADDSCGGTVVSDTIKVRMLCSEIESIADYYEYEVDAYTYEDPYPI